MDTIWIVSAWLIGLLGCIGFYSASRHQRWRARPLPARPTRMVASLLILVSFIMHLQVMYAVPAVFMFLAFTMVALAVLPYVGVAFVIFKRTEQ